MKRTLPPRIAAILALVLLVAVASPQGASAGRGHCSNGRIQRKVSQGDTVTVSWRGTGGIQSAYLITRAPHPFKVIKLTGFSRSFSPSFSSQLHSAPVLLGMDPGTYSGNRLRIETRVGWCTTHVNAITIIK